jgi:hypothetical protein
VDVEPTPEEEYLEGDISHLAMAAIQVHELFLELKKAGFTHKEALRLAGDVLSHAVVDPYGQENEEEEDLDVVYYEMTITAPEDLVSTESEKEEAESLPEEEDPDTIEKD